MAAASAGATGMFGVLERARKRTCCKCDRIPLPCPHRSPAGSTHGSNCRHHHRQEGQAGRGRHALLSAAVRQTLEKTASAGG